MNEEQTSPSMGKLLSLGFLIKSARVRDGRSDGALAARFNMTTDEWIALEGGKCKLCYSTMTQILGFLGIPLDEAFSLNRNDFFPYIRSKCHKEPNELEAEEADELYEAWIAAEVNRDRQFVPLGERIGPRIRNLRRRKQNPIPKLAARFNLTEGEWRALERGKINVPYSILKIIFNEFGVECEETFNAESDDFFPFVRMCLGKTPSDLSPEDANEIFELYSELMELKAARMKPNSEFSDDTENPER